MYPIDKYDLCRLCLCVGDRLMNILEKNETIDFNAQETIEDLLQFKVVEETGYPWLVCLSCLEKLTEFSLFKRRCIKCKFTFEERYLNAVESDAVEIRPEEMDMGHVKIEQPDVEIGQELYPQVILKTIEEEVTQQSSFDEDTTGFLDLADAKNKVVADHKDVVSGVEVAERETAIVAENNNNRQVRPQKTLQTKQEVVRCPTKQVSAKKRRYPCADCSCAFITRSLLLIHRRSHTGERPYECLDCGKRFSKSNDLIRHKMTHTGEKPFKCAICGKQFVRNAHLIRHNRMHTGERPYNCEVCGKGFSERGHLNNHRKRHASVTLFKCTDCGTDFPKKSELLRHNCHPWEEIK